MKTPQKALGLLRKITAAILFLAAIAVSFYLPPVWIIGKMSGLALLGALAAAIAFLDFPLFGPALFLALAYLTRTLFEIRLGIFFIAPLLLYAIIVIAAPPLRKRAPWLAPGRIGPAMWLYGGLVAAIASVALLVWARTTLPDLSDITAFIPDKGLAVLLVLGLGFALVNALVEEAIFRGIFYDSFAHVAGSEVIANIAQAALFGLAHLYGIPRGWAGVGLAFVYGLLLGSIRYYTRGILLVTLIHAAADMTIYLMLLRMIGKI